MKMWEVNGTMETVRTTDDGVCHADMVRVPTFHVAAESLNGAREKAFHVLTWNRLSGPGVFNVVCAETGESAGGYVKILSDGHPQVVQLQVSLPAPVAAWADAVGNWHARITQYGVGDSVAAESSALSAIKTALAQREGPGWTGEGLAVELVSRTSQWGELVSEFAESWPDRVGAVDRAIAAGVSAEDVETYIGIRP